MDEDFIKLRNRVFKAFVITLIFTVPLLFFVINKFGNKPSLILNNINKKEDFLLLIVENKCTQCENIEKILNDKNISYTTLNKDKEPRYEEILKEIDLTKNEIKYPAIIYIKNGSLYSFYVTPTKQQILNYLKTNKFF